MSLPLGAERSPPAGTEAHSALDLTLRALQPLLVSPDVTELCINRPHEVFIESQRGWRRETLTFADFDWCNRFAKLVANASRQRVDETSPLLSASLPGGERVQIVLPPATTLGCVAITIRRAADRIWSIEELGEGGVFAGERASAAADAVDAELLRLHAGRQHAAFLRLAVRSRRNIVVSGATGSGKTTWTKALIREIPADERLITIEDARELVLDSHPNHVRLFYSKDGQGLAQVTPKQLLECCLRMRPDRILLAELRSEEAFDYLRNVSSGHPGSITSVHANSAELAFEQLVLLVKQSRAGRGLARRDIKTLLYLLVDVVVQCARERHRRVIREVWFDPRHRQRLARSSGHGGAAGMTGPFEALAALRGTHALIAAFSAVQLPMMLGLMRSGASLRRTLTSPILAAPVTVAAGAALTVVSPLLPGLGLASTAAQAALGLGIFAVAGYAAGRWTGAADARAAAGYSPVTRRGAAVHELPPQQQRGNGLLRSHAAQHTRRPDAAVTLAGVPLAMSDETRHFKFIGTTGTGKSTAIRELLGGALRRGDRVVIADPDGGYMRSFYSAKRADVILNPFQSGSVRWNLFGEIRTSYDVQQLTRALIPEHGGADRSWREYARTFLGAVISQAHESGARDVGELYRLLMVADTSELRTLLAGTPAQPFLDEHNGRMFDSIRSVTSSAVGALDHIARQESGASFSVRDWVSGTQGRAGGGSGEGGVLFMPYRAGQIPALRSMVSAWMRLAIFEAMDREEGDQRLWFVVDELDALGQIDGLKDALARLRKFGGRCVLGFQSVAQVSDTYGAGEAQTLVENCGNTLILRCSGSERGGTSRFASQLIGERQVVHLTQSRSRRPDASGASVTHSEHLAIEPAVLGAQIEQLPDLQGYLKLASGPVWRRVRLAAPHLPQQVQRPRGVGRLWHRVADRQRAPAAGAGAGSDGYGRE